MQATAKYPVAGIILAIGLTATMDATGYTNFSALILFPLVALFWLIERYPRAAVGLKVGRARDYGLALLYPAAVIGPAVALAALGGAADFEGVDWPAALEEMALIAATTVIGALITEEGFFRGTLWASFERAGFGAKKALLWTSIAFALWHVSFVTLAEGHELALPLVPIYIGNVLLLGAIWGALRAVSGSVVVASVSHGVWNGLVYTFYGATSDPGILGVPESAIWGPETGLLGLALNGVFLAYILRVWKGRRAA